MNVEQLNKANNILKRINETKSLLNSMRNSTVVALLSHSPASDCIFSPCVENKLEITSDCELIELIKKHLEKKIKELEKELERL